MSTPMGAGFGQTPPAPTGKVNFGWLSESFRLFTQAAGVWIVLGLIGFVCGIVILVVLQAVFPPLPNTITGMPQGFPTGNPILTSLTAQRSPMYQVLDYVISLGLGALFMSCGFNLGLMQVQGRQIGFADIPSGARYYVQFLIFVVIYYIASFIGVCALCIGIFVVLGLLIPAGALIARGSSAIDAVTQSINMMKRDVVSASLFTLVFYLVAILSMIPCFIGVFFISPMLYIISALALRDMESGLPPLGFDHPNSQTGSQGAWPPPPSWPTSASQPPSDPGPGAPPSA